MQDSIVEALIKRIRDEVVTDPNMQDVPLAYLMTRDIPQSVQHFFDQEVELWIREEEEKFSSNERFDYDMPDVRMLIDKLFDALKMHANFHITKFNQLLERAVKLEMNYLLAPQRTLTQFIFKDSPIVSTIEVYDTLKYFFRLEYYKNAISEYFNQKYMREISQDQFRDLISQIDEKAFSENRFETTLKTVKSIASFMAEALGEEITSVSISDLHTAFEDRKLDTYAKLMDELSAKGEEKISLSDLESVLREESLDALATDAAPVGEETQIIMTDIEDIEAEKPSIEVEEIDVGEMIVEAPVEEEEEEEEIEELEEVDDETTTVPALETEEQVVEEKEKTGPAANVASDLADFVATQIKSDEPMQNLNEMFVGRARRKIVKRLFHRKEDEFEQLLDELNGHGSWKTASALIDDTFNEKGINPYSKEALMFSDIVYNRFFPKDKYVGESSPDKKF